MLQVGRESCTKPNGNTEKGRSCKSRENKWMTIHLVLITSIRKVGDRVLQVRAAKQSARDNLDEDDCAASSRAA